MTTQTIDPAAAFEAAAFPSWLDEMLSDYRAAVANVFIVHGNVFDYVENPVNDLPVVEYLSQRFRARWTVVNYAPDTGIAFPGLPSESATARARFEGLTGFAPAALSEEERLLSGASAAPSSPSADLPVAPADAVPAIVDFLSRCSREGRGVAILDRLDLIAPPADKGTMIDGQKALLSLLHRSGTLRAMNAAGSLLIMLVPTLAEVHPDLLSESSGIRTVAIPPPDHQERLDFTVRTLARIEVTSELTSQELAAQTAGLTKRNIEDIALRAKMTEKLDADGAVLEAGVITRALVRDRKRQQISAAYADVLEVLEPDITMDMIGGHDLAKAYVQKWIIGPFASGDPELRDLIPLGMALLGPAGTGKTIFARAMARSSGVNCVLLRAEKIKGGIVGQSERLLAKALMGIRAFAPCLVFVDEIDQRFRRAEAGAGDGGSAVESNQFSSLLEFFSDTRHRGEILAVAASNRPDLVDAALFRPGRFDVKVPLLPPDSAEERAAVMRAVLARKGYAIDAMTNTALLAAGASTDGWTQAELERLVTIGLAVSKIDGATLPEAFTIARGRMKPSTREIQRMTALALTECDDVSLVPERWRKLVAEPVAPVDAPRTETYARRPGAPLDI